MEKLIRMFNKKNPVTVKLSGFYFFSSVTNPVKHFYKIILDKIKPL